MLLLRAQGATPWKYKLDLLYLWSQYLHSWTTLEFFLKHFFSLIFGYYCLFVCSSNILSSFNFCTSYWRNLRNRSDFPILYFWKEHGKTIVLTYYTSLKDLIKYKDHSLNSQTYFSHVLFIFFLNYKITANALFLL